MQPAKRSLLRGATVILLATLLAACGAKERRPADDYYRDANTDFRNGAYALAIDQYRELLDEYPFSEYTETAELRIAHANYLAADYVAATVALTDFQRRHPTSPHLPFVGYLLGMCYERQMGTTDRDQTPSENAHAYFATIIQQYPNTPFADLARQELSDCRNNMADHDVQVAEYYAKRGNHKAAELRFLDIAARYPDTTAATQSLHALVDLYLDQDNSEHAGLTYLALREKAPGQAAAIDKKLGASTLGSLPDTKDPLGLLLAANGRQRPAAGFTLPHPTADLGTPKTGPGFPAIDSSGRANLY